MTCCYAYRWLEWQNIRSADFIERRPVVEITLCMGPKLIRTHVTLNDRSKVKYPIIVGRNILKDNFIVDCTKSNCSPPKLSGGSLKMKRPAVLLAVALLLVSFALICYRIIWLKYPIFPAAPEKVWQLSMDAHVKGGDKETTVMIGVPYTHRGQLVAEERIRSGTLNFNLLREGLNQVGVWSGVTRT